MTIWITIYLITKKLNPICPKRNLNKYHFFILLFILQTTFSDFLFCQVKSSKPFSIDFNREAAIFGSGAVAAVSAYAVLKNLKPLTVEDIEMLDPSNVNKFDRNAIGPFMEDHLGDALLYTSYAIPLSFVFFDETRSDIWELTLMYSEVLLIQSSINGIVKGTVQRIRPFVYDVQSPTNEKQSNNARISFYSGHTSMAAAISFFTARVFTEYVDNNTVRILMWTGAAILPAITAVTRVNTHWHFPTDVIAGYVIGALVGYLIPEMHKTNLNSNGNLSFYPSINLNKPELSFQFRF